MAHFIATISEYFDVDGGEVKIAVIAYSTEIMEIDHFNSMNTNEEVYNTIINSDYHGGETATGV